MSKILDTISQLRIKIRDASVPPNFEARLISLLEETERASGSIEHLAQVDQAIHYIDFAISLPWNKRTTDQLDLAQASQMLHQNHFGLEFVKDRILEYLAVLKLQMDRHVEVQSNDVKKLMRAPILCLVGLVGTGKTTLASSIAQAMGRKFIRIPFGGMSDALELRGQSRVKADAEVGKILRAMHFVGSRNPVILLDEIDRVAEDKRADIMGVLVELLDPEQNAAFTDHYLDYPFDLSEVLFVATANNTTHIATAVLDRLEPIQMPSYTDQEKITIGREYVFKRILKESGLTLEQVVIDDNVWPQIVRPLGFDSGIRSLERTINGVCRKIARMIVEGKAQSVHITAENVKDFLPSW